MPSVAPTSTDKQLLPMIPEPGGEPVTSREIFDNVNCPMVERDQVSKALHRLRAAGMIAEADRKPSHQGKGARLVAAYVLAQPPSQAQHTAPRPADDTDTDTERRRLAADAMMGELPKVDQGGRAPSSAPLYAIAKCDRCGTDMPLADSDVTTCSDCKDKAKGDPIAMAISRVAVGLPRIHQAEIHAERLADLADVLERRLDARDVAAWLRELSQIFLECRP